MFKYLSVDNFNLNVCIWIYKCIFQSRLGTLVLKCSCQRKIYYIAYISCGCQNWDCTSTSVWMCIAVEAGYPVVRCICWNHGKFKSSWQKIWLFVFGFNLCSCKCVCIMTYFLQVWTLTMRLMSYLPPFLLLCLVNTILSWFDTLGWINEGMAIICLVHVYHSCAYNDLSCLCWFMCHNGGNGFPLSPISYRKQQPPHSNMYSNCHWILIL